MVDWLNDNSAAVQAISVVALAIVTAIYAWRTWTISKATEKQAASSQLMAEEMRETRHGGVLPVVDFILEPLSGSEELARVFSIKGGHFPENVWGHLKNIGLGPALDIRFQTKLDDMGPNWDNNIGHLAIEEVVEMERELGLRGPCSFYLEPVEDSVKRLRVDYCDVYGRRYNSWRDVSFDRENGKEIVGPLHIKAKDSGAPS